jgi:uncharacterized membrane protein YhaH (DUF805 family)
MSWRWLFFSFQGRINRSTYWLAMLVYLLVGICFAVLDWALNGLGILQVRFGQIAALQAVQIALDLALWLSCLSVIAKRLHDRDRSSWWLLMLYLAPVAAALFVGLAGATASDLAELVGRLCILAALAFSVWFFVELGCLPGTRGYNRYGRDPLAMGVSSLRPVR